MPKAEFDFQIIVNLMSGKGSAGEVLERLKEFLDGNKQTYRVLTIDRPTPISKIPEDGRVLIKKAVICLGGDGTVSETVGYVLNHQIEKPIALIPTGTANIIASTLGVSGQSENFHFLLEDNLRKVDVGVADFGGEKNYFLLGLGLGFEEKFLRLAKEKSKARFGVLSYILAALSELISLHPIPLKIKSSDFSLEVPVCLLAVLNLKPQILNYFPLFKDSGIKCDDGVFNVYYVEYRHYWQALLGTLLFHLSGRLNFGLVKSFCSPGFEVESPVVCGTQIDGELRSCLPVKVRFHHRPILFLTH